MDLSNVQANIKAVSSLLKAVSNERRLHILCILQKGEQCVGELETIIPVSQSALSQHLARLRKDDLVATRRDAQTVYYRIKSNKVETLMDVLSTMYADDAVASIH